jgi:hypothetical protein
MHEATSKILQVLADGKQYVFMVGGFAESPYMYEKI